MAGERTSLSTLGVPFPHSQLCGARPSTASAKWYSFPARVSSAREPATQIDSKTIAGTSTGVPVHSASRPVLTAVCLLMWRTTSWSQWSEMAATDLDTSILRLSETLR
jgi:hypothetical protein